MKILFISDLYPLQNDRTIPLVVEDFALGLRELGNEILVIRPNFILNCIIRKHKILKNKTYIRNGIKIFNRNFFLPFLFEKKQFINKFKNFDVIISHMPSGNIYSNLINRELKLPNISIVHESDYKVLFDFKYSFYFKNRLKKALLNSRLIGARNEFLYKKLNASFVLPSFINKENIVQKEYKKLDKIKIITLSKLIKRKNIDKVILALKDANFDYEYNIYGEGSEKTKLLKLIKKYNLEEKIKLHGYIEHSEIYKKLDENDVFILPSIHESFGISYLEAMQRNLVVVAVKNTGIDGIIKDNENGFLINPCEKEILEVLNKINKENMSQILINSHNTIKKYEKEKIITKYFEIIKNNL